MLARDVLVIFAVLALAAAGLACTLPHDEPIPITVLVIGSMSEDHARAALATVPPVWSFTFAPAVEGENWVHSAELFPHDLSLGAMPAPITNHTLCLSFRNDFTNAGRCDGIALNWTGSASVYDCGNATRFGQVIVHELAHTLPGVTVWHTQAELDADPGFQNWRRAHPQDGEALTLSNAYAIAQWRGEA